MTRRFLASCASVILGGSVLVGLAPQAVATECSKDKASYVKAPPWPLAMFDIDQAWALTRGQGVVVAVVDSGIERSNAHFAPAGSGDEVFRGGVSLVGGDAYTDPTLGHGTAVAGIIAARPTPQLGSGMVGVAPQATLMSIKVATGDEAEVKAGGPDLGRVADGIRRAADAGAKVINVSISTTKDDRNLHASADYARSKGALVIASAGNRNTTSATTDSPRYPAAYDGVVGVSESGEDGRVDDNSIHGKHVDVGAPGQNVLTTFFGAGDCIVAADEKSSSFATAYVSGAAALIAARYPAEGPAGWKKRLEVTAARDQRATRDDLAGWGVIAPYVALTSVIDGSVTGPGQSPPVQAAQPPRQVPVHATPDPYAKTAGAALWWGLGGLTLGLGLILATLLATRRRSPRAAKG